MPPPELPTADAAAALARRQQRRNELPRNSPQELPAVAVDFRVSALNLKSLDNGDRLSSNKSEISCPAP